MELVSGLAITPSVRLVQKLGEGGMGSVWIADHLTLHTQVAVKFMTEHLAQNPDAAARFSREATAAAQIKSPHVVQTFDHGLYEERVPYIVMELLEGEELSKFMRRQGPLSLQVTAQIITQMCKALSKAHAKNVIHRDIKPDNVFLIESDGEIFVKVLDFGIAKQVKENVHVTSTGAVMGTPHYMSPEQMLSSKHVDGRSDLWAVAVVAYQCVTGSVPFDGETFAAIAIAIAQAQFGPPFAQHGVGSPELDAWFARALARDPDQRFGTAREMAEALTAVVSASGIRATQTSGFLGSVGTGTSQSWGENTGLKAELNPASPKTFNGVAATMSGTSHRKAFAIGAGVGLVVLFVVIGVVATTLQGHKGAAETAAAPPAEPAPAETVAEAPAQELLPEPTAEPQVTPEPSAEVPAVPAQQSVPTASKKTVRRPRAAKTSAPQEPTAKPKSTVPDRGF